MSSQMLPPGPPADINRVVGGDPDADANPTGSNPATVNTAASHSAATSASASTAANAANPTTVNTAAAPAATSSNPATVNTAAPAAANAATVNTGTVNTAYTLKQVTDILNAICENKDAIIAALTSEAAAGEESVEKNHNRTANLHENVSTAAAAAAAETTQRIEEEKKAAAAAAAAAAAGEVSNKRSEGEVTNDVSNISAVSSIKSLLSSLFTINSSNNSSNNSSTSSTSSSNTISSFKQINNKTLLADEIVSNENNALEPLKNYIDDVKTKDKEKANTLLLESKTTIDYLVKILKDAKNNTKSEKYDEQIKSYEEAATQLQKAVDENNKLPSSGGSRKNKKKSKHSSRRSLRK